MRRLLIPFMLVFLAGALLALGACGGDDNSSGEQQGGLQLEATPPPVAPTGPTADPGATAQQGATGTTSESRKSRRSRRNRSGGGGGNSGSPNNATQEPQQPQGTQQQPQGNTRREKLNEEIAEALTGEGQAKISYEAARTVCRERKKSELKATYKPKGSSNEDIAKAVSRVYKPKSRSEAAYDGCLKGLSER
jgi:hypothetical protein